MKEKFAKLIRAVTVPPILVAILIVVLAMKNPDIFRNSFDYIIALVFLGYFIGRTALPACALMLAVSFWSSLTLKRHKATELLGGSVVCRIVH